MGGCDVSGLRGLSAGHGRVSVAAGDRRFIAARVDDDDDDNASLTSLPTDAAAAAAAVGATDRGMRSEERAMRGWFGRAAVADKLTHRCQLPRVALTSLSCILRPLVVSAVLFLYKRSADDPFASK